MLLNQGATCACTDGQYICEGAGMCVEREDFCEEAAPALCPRKEDDHFCGNVNVHSIKHV